MSILTQDDKVLSSVSGEIINPDASVSTKIHIDTDLQLPNRIFKDGSNLVRQITDKAQNIPFLSKHASVSVNPSYAYNDGDGFPYIAFLPTTKGLISKDAVNIDYTKSFVIELMWRPTVFPYASNQYLFSHCSASDINLGAFVRIIGNQTTINSNLVSIDPSLVGITLTAGVWYHLMYIIDQDSTVKRVFAYLNGKYVGPASIPAKGNVTQPLGVGITPYGNGVNTLNGDVSYCKVYSGLGIMKANQTLPTTGQQVFTPRKPFFYYKRYKDDGYKKLFFSSKYLKDASIDVSNQITTIKDEFDSIITDAGTNKVKWNPKGFYFNQSFLTNSGYLIGTNDFFIGFWIKNTDSANSDLFKNSNITISKVSNNYDINSNTIGLFSTSNYEYLTVIRRTGILYWFINGKYIGSVSDTSNYTLSDLIIGSNSFIGYIDGVLLSIGDSIIDPTGFSVGQKVFNPPLRGGFDSEIFKFPVP